MSGQTAITSGRDQRQRSAPWLPRALGAGVDLRAAAVDDGNKLA